MHIRSDTLEYTRCDRNIVWYDVMSVLAAGDIRCSCSDPQTTMHILLDDDDDSQLTSPLHCIQYSTIALNTRLTRTTTMSATSLLSVLLIGATGTLGSHIANGFLLPQYASKVKLSLLVRKETALTVGPKKDALDALVAKGASIIYGDVTASEADLKQALIGQSVVISAVGATQLGAQVSLVAAAKSAGVSWIVPSEFGYDASVTGTSVVPIFEAKLAVVKAIKDAGLAYTLVYTGAFAEYTLSPFFGVDIAASTITAPGSFDSYSSITPLAEIGRLLADAVTSGKGKNQVLKFGAPRHMQP